MEKYCIKRIYIKYKKTFESIRSFLALDYRQVPLLCTLLCCHLQVMGQITSPPARWQFSVAENRIKVGREATLRLEVELDDTWYIYSTDQDPEVGPLPTEIRFEPHKSYALVGAPVPVKMIQKYDEIWLDSIRIVEESGGGFLQKIRVLDENPVIKGKIIYSVCSMETGLCVFPKKDFEFTGMVVASSKRRAKKKDPKKERAVSPLPQPGLPDMQ